MDMVEFVFCKEITFQIVKSSHSRTEHQYCGFFEYGSQHRHKNDKIKMEKLLLKKKNLLWRGLSQLVGWSGL